MFDFAAQIVGFSASIAYPVFASYKALKSHENAHLQLWMMHWIVLACFLTAEYWTWFILTWIPFYHEIRACFMIWLVLPGTEGSQVLYTSYVYPTLESHQEDIETFLIKALDQGRIVGIATLRSFIRYVEDYVLNRNTNNTTSSLSAASVTSPAGSRQQSSKDSGVLSNFINRLKTTLDEYDATYPQPERQQPPTSPSININPAQLLADYLPSAILTSRLSRPTAQQPQSPTTRQDDAKSGQGVPDTTVPGQFEHDFEHVNKPESSLSGAAAQRAGPIVDTTSSTTWWGMMTQPFGGRNSTPPVISGS